MAGGVTVMITEKTGARRTTVTFRDGGFYLMGIKPGEYEIAVSEAVLDGSALRRHRLPLPWSPAGMVPALKISTCPASVTP